jgi:hypothetical protein
MVSTRVILTGFTVVSATSFKGDIRPSGGLSLKALAGSLGVEESTVSRAASQVVRLRRENPNWDRVVHKIEKSISSNI